MKYILIALLILHALIHLMGFAKAFGWAQPAALQTPISRPAGLLWLTTTLLLLASTGLILMARQEWWLPAIVGIVLSQVLIVATWNEAKAGTIVNVLLLLPVVVTALAAAPGGFRATYDHEVAARLRQPPAEIKLLTEADIAHLPAVVRRYLAFVGAVGKPQVWNYRLRFDGGLRNGPADEWMKVVMHQQSFVDPPARLFLVESSKFGIPFNAFHRYIGPEATFQVKLASLLTVVDARGPEMNQSETVTMLNDMCLLAPATLIDRRMKWEELDERNVRVTWTNEGNTVSAVLTFDPSGALVNFVSEDRSRTTDGKRFEKLRWSTPVQEWRDFNGRKLPYRAEASWNLPEGEFAYARFEIAEAEYNVTNRK